MYQVTKYKRKEPRDAALFNSFTLSLFSFPSLEGRSGGVSSSYFPGLALKLYVIPIACWNDRSSVRMIFWLLGFTFTSRS